MNLLIPILVTPAIAGLLCLLVRSRRVMEAANALAFGATLALGVRLLGEVLVRQSHVVTECEEFFRADALSAWMVLLISVVSLGTSLYAGRYFRRDLAAGMVTPGRVKEFFVLTPLFTTGMLLVVLANNLGVMWFALEATALSSVLLVALYNRNTSLEAAWKYVILGSLGLALALFGTVFTYAAAIDKSSSALPSFNWSHLMSVAGQLDRRMIKLAFVFVLVGYGAKAGLAPMHTWLPDAHSEAPSPTSAMLSGVSLKVALYALLRFHILATECLGSSFSRTLLLVFGLGSMCLAIPFILVQTNLKRLLAYSSLEHVGLICAGIGLNSPITIFGALLHMGYHALTKPVLFFAAGNIHQSCHTLHLRAIGPGLAKMLPLTVVGMGLAAAAAMGLPPFGLFFSEMTVLNGGFAAGHTAVSILVLAALLGSFCGILYQLTRILLGAPRIVRTSDAAPLDGLPGMGLMLGALLLFSLWLPAPLLEVIQQAAGIIEGKQ
jgi:hydrogenase-4 component F